MQQQTTRCLQCRYIIVAPNAPQTLKRRLGRDAAVLDARVPAYYAGRGRFVVKGEWLEEGHSPHEAARRLMVLAGRSFDYSVFVEKCSTCRLVS